MSELEPPERELVERHTALEQIVELARDRYDTDLVAAATDVIIKVDERLRHGTAHTVVALAGPTGSGKSSLFNAVVGDSISTTSVRRPTTARTHAAVFGPDDAAALLDWLEVDRRHLLGADPNLERARLSGLVLLDLPDHDSTAVDHQIEVDRLVGLVDLLVWVVEPQKYADHAMHDRYLRPLATHGDVMVFVISKCDLLAESDRLSVETDFAALLRDDGLTTPRVVSVSTTTGFGLDDFLNLLGDEADSRRATVDRLTADMGQTAMWFASEGSGPERVGDKPARLLSEGLANAAGAEQAADVVARQHQRNGAIRTGWPGTRWIRRLRRQPFGDVPVAAGNVAAEAKADVALRAFADTIGQDLGDPWPAAVRQRVAKQRDEVIAELGQITTGQSRLVLDRPGWWKAARAWQSVVGLAAVVGAIWLFVLAVLGGFFQLDTAPLALEVPGVDWLPIPTALVLGGILLGLIGAFVARIANRVGANRRARKVRRQIVVSVDDVSQNLVVAPVNEVLADHNELTTLVDSFAGRK